MWFFKTAFLFGLAVCGGALANDKDFLNLGTSDTMTFYVPDGKLNHRIGSGVWIKLIASRKGAKYNTTQDLVLGCSGDWYSSPIRFDYSDSNTLPGKYYSSEARAKSQPENGVAIETGFDPSDKTFSNLRTHIKRLCSSARKDEPKDKLFPLTENQYDEVKGGTVYSMVLNSARKNPNGNIDVWIKESTYMMVDLTDPDGEPVMMDGRVVRIRDFENSGFSMSRNAFNCENKTSGIISVTDYDSKGKYKDSYTWENGPKMKEVVPQSVAEGQLDWVCLLYGK